MVHHIDDFDVRGPEKTVKKVENQPSELGFKLKVGELEGMEGESGTSPEYLGREKCSIDGCVVTKPNDKHIQNILGKLGMEDANRGV